MRRPPYRDVMPRGEWDDNSWYDDGDFPPASKEEGRGGMVATAIFSFLMCAVNGLGTLLFFCCSGFWALVAADNQGGLNILPADMVQRNMWLSLGVGALSVVFFFLQLFAGLGLLHGRRWARTVTLNLAGCSIVVAIGLVVWVIFTFIENGGGEEAGPLAAVMITAAILHATYAIVEFSLLLQSSIARRYR
jgi:hypothetical protein